jgi:hypothetical protein
MADQDKKPTDKDADPVFSTLLAESPELWEVVEEFVRSLPERITAMQDALHEGAIERLRTCADQLRSAGMDYGYDQLSRRSAEMEQALHGGEIDRISQKITEITSLVDRIREGLNKDPGSF